MDQGVVKVIIESFIKELISESKVIFNILHEEGKQFLGKSLKKYLEKHKDKFSSIKTLLKGNTPVYLYDIYYPVNLVGDKVVTIETSNINNLFLSGNYVTIIGDAGSGKSTLVKHLFLNSIHRKFAIPVLIELRYLNGTNGDLEEHICDQLFDNNLSTSKRILERLFEKGKFVFFLDGFDELNSDIRNHVIKGLNDFMSKYDENKFIVTSRPFSNIESLSIFRNLHVKKLDKNDITNFIDLQLKTEKELAEKIIISLKESKSSYIQSFLANPLLLTLYILTFQTYAEIPDKKYIFYRRVINALFSEHDSKTKLGYVREKQSQLNQEQFEEILKAFSYLSYFEEHFDFDYDYLNDALKKIKKRKKDIDFDSSKFTLDMKSAIALWTEDNGKYSFAHRSLQEYFAAAFIKNLNPLDNERAYQKIKNNFAIGTKPLSEYQNFLSLLNEMDEISFYTHYYIPLLKELRGLLNNENRESLIKSFVLFFTNKINIIKAIGRDKSEITYIQIQVRPEVYRSIYLHLNFTQKLFDELEKVFGSLVEKHKFDEGEFKSCYLIDEDCNEDILKLCMTSRIYSIANSLLVFTEKEIKNKEQFIKQAIKTDKDLLDLID